jgi:hypothetical protein
MERYNVPSSNVSSVGYDPQTQTLEVEFLNGTIYQYYGVPQNMYDQMMQEQSKGQFLNTYIRNQYAYSRVG